MINRKLFGVVSLVVLAVCAGCSQSPSESPDPTPSPSPSSGVRLSAPSVVGTWALVKFQGQPVPGESPQPIWQFTDTDFLMTIGDQTLKGSYTIDSSTEPNSMTMTVEGEPKGGRGIFNLTEDTFIIKIREEDEVLAENFETEEGYKLMEFRRKQ